MDKVRIFVNDDLPGLEETIKKIFPKSEWRLRVLHAVRDSPNKVRKGDWQGVAERLQTVVQGGELKRRPRRTKEVAAFVR